MKHMSFTRSNLEETSERIYVYISDYIRRNGYAPAVRDIAAGVGVRSTSTVHSHLKRLEEMGRIAYGKGKRRAITLIAAQQEGAAAEARGAARQARVPSEAFKAPRAAGGRDTDIYRSIPLIGTVTAGVPILAQEQVEDYLPFPAHFYNPADELFMLHVRGDSMCEAGILDGDLVVVRKAEQVDFGRIIVALLGEEATVKRLVLREQRPFLKPENPAYSWIPFDKASSRILGEVIQVLRTHVR